jgi:hypothetical protein
MNYSILIYETPGDFDRRNDPQAQEAYWAAWPPYAQALRDAGVYVTGFALQAPTTATTVASRDGERQVQDGPFADTKEQLGGVIVIDVPNLDVALDWAARCPTTVSGYVEVRPILDNGTCSDSKAAVAEVAA